MTECAYHSLSGAIAEAYKRGNKVLVCGNGGLAAESEHFAAELMGKYGRELFIPAISLTANSSLLTALANDYGFETVFSRQVATLGVFGDVLIGMTTSASKNVINAITTGDLLGLTTFLIDRTIIVGESVGEVQNNIIRFLHEVALEAKELAVENPVR